MDLNLNLDELDDRYELVKEMIDKAFELEESVANLEDDNDWGGVMTTLENLSAVEDMICAEEIFLDALDEMREVKTYDRDEKETFLSIVFLDGLNAFYNTVLLPRLNHTLKNLNEWGFRTEGGIEFQKEFSEKLDALIKEYYFLRADV